MSKEPKISREVQETTKKYSPILEKAPFIPLSKGICFPSIIQNSYLTKKTLK